MCLPCWLKGSLWLSNMYEIRLCRKEEKPLLIDFLTRFWSEDHIFVKHETLLDFQHKSGEYYNFVVAYHSTERIFHGVLGFMSPSHYSKNEIKNGKHIWLGIWRVVPELSKDSTIGFRLFEFIQKTYNPDCISATGLNENVIPIYKLMGFKTTKINQWFIKNELKLHFKIGVGLQNIFSSPCSQMSELIGKELDFQDLTKFKFLNQLDATRCLHYISKRYINHPIYDYIKLGFFDGVRPVGIAIGRFVGSNSSRAFRITDLWVSEQKNFSIYNYLQEFMVCYDLEYIDFLEFGWAELDLTKNGFHLNQSDKFVPHNFEPFSRKKVDVNIAYKTSGKFVCTKGDCDLDRPRLLNLHKV